MPLNVCKYYCARSNFCLLVSGIMGCTEAHPQKCPNFGIWDPLRHRNGMELSTLHLTPSHSWCHQGWHPQEGHRQILLLSEMFSPIVTTAGDQQAPCSSFCTA